MPNSQVIQLSNVSTSPETSYAIDNDEMVEVVVDYLNDRPQHEIESFTKDAILVWHTHPSGHIGPSDRDMDEKEPGMRYYVYAMPDGPGSMF